jgi:hypothetical protein
MALPSLDDGHLLLACLAVGVRSRDPVLVSQVAHKADKVLSASALRRSFGRLRNYGVSEQDMAWLASLDI